MGLPPSPPFPCVFCPLRRNCVFSLASWAPRQEVFPSGFGAWKRSVVQGNTDVQGQESEDQRESQNEDADIFWISLGDELPPLLVRLDCNVLLCFFLKGVR